MNYDTLMHKLASADLPINHRLENVMAKVRVAGLHKAAAVMHGMPAVTLKTATYNLGYQLLATHLKFKKIATGLQALEPVKRASINPLPTAGRLNPARTTALLNLLKEMQQPAESMAGRQLGGAMNRGRPGMFSGIAPEVNSFNPQAIPELPAMGRLPTGP